MNTEKRKLYVVHDTFGGTYLRVLEAVGDVEYLDVSIVKGLLRHLLQRGKVAFSWRRWTKSILGRLACQFENSTIIVGVAPYDFRLMYFLPWRLFGSGGCFIYHTSSSEWTAARVYRRYGPFTKIFEKYFTWFLADPRITVVAVTKMVQRAVRAKFPAVRCSYIPHYIENEYFLKDVVKQRYYAFIGRLIEEKGIQELLLAASIIYKKHGWRLLIAGDGPLRSRVIEACKEGSVVYLGSLDKDGLAEHLFSRAAYLISASKKVNGWQEVFGKTIVEGMAAGMIPFATKHEGPLGIIEEGKNGFFLEETDLVRSILDRFDDMMRSPVEEVARVRAEGAKTSEGFRYDRIARAYTLLLDELEDAIRVRSDKRRVGFITNIPTPYRSELISEWDLAVGGFLEVRYMAKGDEGREWKAPNVLGCREGRLPLLWANAKIGYLNTGLFRFSTQARVILLGGLDSISYWAVAIIAYISKTKVIIICDGFPPLRIGREHFFMAWAKMFLVWLSDGSFANAALGKRYIEGLGARAGTVADQCLSSWYKVPEYRRATVVASQEEKIVCFCGYLIERKDVATLVEALRIAKSRTLFKIIGKGPLRDKILELCKSYQIKVDCKGFFDKEEVLLEIGRSDILVLPSREDSWGLVVNEALSQGTPVVASDNCGASVLLADSDVSAVFPVGDHISLARQIDRLLSGDRNTQRIKARALVEGINPRSSGRNLAQLIAAMERDGGCVL